MNPYQIGDEIEILIDRLSYDGGRGVGRYQNFVFFIPKTAPQETVKARITSLKKNFGEAELLEILSPSPHRREPPCPVAGRCGGCVWQHVNYDEQLRQKKELLKFHLKRVWNENLPEPEIAASPNEFRYRNRVQIHRKGSEFGFFALGTNNIVPIKDCLISDERLFSDLDDQLSREVRTSKNKEDKKPRAMKLELALNDSGKRIVRNLADDESEFTQVNSAQNLKMRDWVLAALKKAETNHYSKIFDLYCGSGNLTFPIAAQWPQTAIEGVEFSPQAISRAKLKLMSSASELRKLAFKAQDVQLYLEKLKPSPKTAIVLDPPRAGLGNKVTQELLRLKPDVIVYVSCNLSTLTRDLAALSELYKLSSVAGLDMFPQTEYLECLVTLVPRATH